MALTALEIYKYLPKTNCGKCNAPTCLAFAMQLAQKKVSLSDCPYITEEAKDALAAAAEPPIRLVSIGPNENRFETGQETVLFRHEETFYHQTGIGALVSDDLTIEQLLLKISEIEKLKFQRVGAEMKIDFICIENHKLAPDDFASFVSNIKTKLNLIIKSNNPEAVEKAVSNISNLRPLIGSAKEENLEKFAEISKKYNLPLSIYSTKLENLADMTRRLNSLNIKDIILDLSYGSISQRLENLTKVRRIPLKKNFRPLGYPTIMFTESTDSYEEIAEASVYVSKYAGIVILKTHSLGMLLPLLTLRQNIYTDPRKPVQVEPKIYEIGRVDNNSPVLVTTNFSITYFTVASDVEASKIPSYIISIDTEGTSVLTAYASDKFNAEKISEVLNKADGIKNMVTHRKVIIPGVVAVMSGKLEELSKWHVMVGPRESAGIPKYLRTVWKP